MLEDNSSYGLHSILDDGRQPFLSVRESAMMGDNNQPEKMFILDI